MALEIEDAPENIHQSLVPIEYEVLEYAHGVAVLDLVNVERDEEWRKSGTNRKVLLFEVLADVRVIPLQRVIEYVDYFHELGHLFHVNAPPLVTVEDEYEAPEDLLLVLDMHQEHCGNVVEALDVADLGVVICIS